MTFDGLMLPELLSHSNASMWDPSKLAALSQGFPAMAPQAMHSDCYSHEGGYSGPSLSQGLSQGYGPGLQMPQYTEMPYNMDAMDSMQDPSFPSYGSMPQVLPNHDASLLQVLQSQMAAANLLAAHGQAGQMQMQPMANSALQGMDLLMQGQYYDLLNQASLQAVQSVLQQRLATSQQLNVLQQLLSTTEAPSPNKPSKRSNRNGGSSKQRHQARNSRKGSVAQQAPSWADGNWNPLSNVQAKGKGPREQHGTGVFLPQGFPVYSSELSSSDQMSEASSDQSSGSAFR